MTQQPYQQQQGYPGQPNYAPAPGYPPAQPGYAVQPYQQQPPPQQYYSPQPAPTGYQPQQPGYPPQNGYGQPPQPPQPELPRGSLKDYVDQPAGGFGPSLAFPQAGTQYWCTVARNVGDADIKPQTDMITGEVRTFPDGRVKWMMCVPVLMQPSPQYPEGIATWYVKGNDRAEMTRAMEAAGVGIDPATGTLFPPRAGDTFHVHFTHESASSGKGRNPTKVKRVTYTMGNGEAPPPQVVQGQVIQAYQQATGQQMPGAFSQPTMQMAQPALAQPQNPTQQLPPVLQGYNPQPGFAFQQPQLSYPQNPPQQPQYQQPQVQNSMQGAPVPQNGYQQPDSALAYQQATGQQMQPQQPGPYGQPNADWNPYAQQPQPPQQQFDPAQAQQFQQQYQQPAFPTPAPPVPGGPPSGPAQPSGAPSPSSPPPGWPADVPFMEGLTPEMARVAASVKYPGTQMPPQQ
ncbi:MAG TPA: hypothetical protein VGG75_14095 [Trebonia sp.]